MVNIIDGRNISRIEAVSKMTNCRLKKTQTVLQFLLSAVELEMDARMGKGGGGLK